MPGANEHSSHALSIRQGLSERAPYWLVSDSVALPLRLSPGSLPCLTVLCAPQNGIVPLAHLISNAEAEADRNRKTATEAVSDYGVPDASLQCVKGMDMPYADIATFVVNDTSVCADACANTPGCLAWTVDACAAPVIQCWLKRAIGDPTTGTSCRCTAVMPTPPSTRGPDLLRQARTYIDYILAHQQPSGWLGPDTDTSGTQYWARFNVMLSLAMWAEGQPATFPNVTKAMLNYAQESYRRQQKTPMTSWAAQRYQDFVLSVQWLLDNAPQGAEQMLMDLAEMSHAQGNDWESWFETFTNGSNHGVNNAQALKSAAVWYRQSGNASLPQLSRSRLANMDRIYGMPTGMFCADETLCEAPETKMPSRGTELCAVVEAMYSYATMFSVHGDVQFIDRAERIAYNALPATWGDPEDGYWAHQYLQAVNEIAAETQADHVWTHDGPDAEKYGLAPNYGCCTANQECVLPAMPVVVFVTATNAHWFRCVPGKDGLSLRSTVSSSSHLTGVLLLGPSLRVAQVWAAAPPSASTRTIRLTTW